MTSKLTAYVRMDTLALSTYKMLLLPIL